MTGAAIPRGCNAVVMLELTEGFERNERTYMTLKRCFAAGDNISFKGEDVKQNTILVKEGTVINELQHFLLRLVIVPYTL